MCFAWNADIDIVNNVDIVMNVGIPRHKVYSWELDGSLYIRCNHTITK